MKNSSVTKERRLSSPGETGFVARLIRGAADGRLPDVGFLISIVLLSAVLYVPALGLYSDDWAFLSDMHLSRDQSFLGYYEALMRHGLETRPLQASLFAGLFRLFGLAPFGYHAANTLILCTAVLLLYLSLRALGLPRLLAVAVPLVYALLPHYSTARFWISASQANLCVALYALSLFADIRFVREAGRDRWLWKLLGLLALLGSVLAYEITAALFLVNPFIAWYAARVKRPESPRAAATQTALLFSMNGLALLAAVAYKAGTTERSAFLTGLLWRVVHTAKEGTAVHFGSYGAGLPVKVVQAVTNYFDPLILLVSVLVAMATWVYFNRAIGPHERRTLSRATWLRLILVGGIIFAAGYGVSLLTFEIGYDTTGMNNRTAGGAALGTALVFVAFLGLASTFFRTETVRWRAYLSLIALLAGSGCLLINTIGRFWIEAAQDQEIVVSALERQFPSIEPGTTLLLDGICPYRGPGVVFETRWDVEGMLHVVYGDRSLVGDVMKPNSEIGDSGIRTLLYDDVINVYPYDDNLIVFHVPRSEAQTLSTREVASDYFADRDGGDGPSCPPGEAGYGARIF